MWLVACAERVPLNVETDEARSIVLWRGVDHAPLIERTTANTSVIVRRGNEVKLVPLRLSVEELALEPGPAEITPGRSRPPPERLDGVTDDEVRIPQLDYSACGAQSGWVRSMVPLEEWCSPAGQLELPEVERPLPPEVTFDVPSFSPCDAGHARFGPGECQPLQIDRTITATTVVDGSLANVRVEGSLSLSGEVELNEVEVVGPIILGPSTRVTATNVSIRSGAQWGLTVFSSSFDVNGLYLEADAGVWGVVVDVGGRFAADGMWTNAGTSVSGQAELSNVFVHGPLHDPVLGLVVTSTVATATVTGGVFWQTSPAWTAIQTLGALNLFDVRITDAGSAVVAEHAHLRMRDVVIERARDHAINGYPTGGTIELERVHISEPGPGSHLHAVGPWTVSGRDVFLSGVPKDRWPAARLEHGWFAFDRLQLHSTGAFYALPVTPMTLDHVTIVNPALCGMLVFDATIEDISVEDVRVGSVAFQTRGRSRVLNFRMTESSGIGLDAFTPTPVESFDVRSTHLGIFLHQQPSAGSLRRGRFEGMRTALGVAEDVLPVPDEVIFSNEDGEDWAEVDAPAACGETIFTP